MPSISSRTRARRQELAGLRADRVEEVERDGGAGPGDAVDGDVAVILHPPPGGADGGVDDGRRVDVVDAHDGLAVLGRHEAALDGERADARDHVAAVRGGVDEGAVDLHLREQVVDVGVRAARLRHDGDLAGERVGAAEPVDLALVGRSHDGEQHPVAQVRLTRQIVGEEVRPLRRAAAHEHARDRRLLHRHLLSPSPSPSGESGLGRGSVRAGWASWREAPYTAPA